MKPELLKLDLGCGNQKVTAEHIGVDFSRACNPDVILDLLDYPWPWADNSVEDIYCSHYIEHIPMRGMSDRHLKDPLIMFFEECYRILTPGGMLYLRFPVCTAEPAFQDPTHKRYLSRHLVAYFNQPWRKWANVEQYYIKADFQIITDKVQQDESVMGRAQSHRFAHYHFNVIHAAHLDLQAVKPCRT